MPLSVISNSETHIADMNLFVAFGRPESGQLTLL